MTREPKQNPEGLFVRLDLTYPSLGHALPHRDLSDAIHLGQQEGCALGEYEEG